MGKFSITDLPDLSGKVAIVTGGTNGLGEISVRNLALKGAKVYFTARSESKARATIERAQANFDTLKSKANKEGVTVKGEELDLRILQCDLTDMSTVQAAAQDFLSKEERLDILMNNAAVCALDHELTKDGVEIQNGTNLISHYFLVMLLLPIMIKTSKLPEYTAVTPEMGARRTVRIVNMSSLGHKMIAPRQNWRTLADVNDGFEDQKFGAFKRYGMSKLACIVFTRELARLLRDQAHEDGVSVVCVDPGQSRTGLLNGPLQQYGFLFKIYIAFSSPTWIPAEQAVETQLFAACSPQVDQRALNGAYIRGNGKESPMSDAAADKDGHLGKEVMQFCKNFVKEKFALDVDHQLGLSNPEAAKVKQNDTKEAAAPTQETAQPVSPAA
ncbi:NAD(P)-binding protein [Tilletiaria anomala UBC 951]|uniref:NAD(P)-binding protein n=1 Tax=Tilletiaria anomala (strain ATCC 24038 / CBS 436.72 / UBC 951) TaxID=1037660 RepID=A0A066VVC1_TILAU|nr:NAD(P)-binding protein [Tilletiaria anomala UBC 951]KDN42500.1 NAD(P)-binding protein [Tilletiaria anomala UBC 951]